MENFYDVIKTNPEYFGWLFIFANALWALFTYFNKKSHEKKLVEIKQSLDLDLERRKKVFEMKVGHYEAYFNRIDTFNRKHKSDYQDIINPLFNEFMEKYLEANGKKKSTKVTVWFGEQISKITAEMFQEYSLIEAETNSLRLTASDDVARLLEELIVIQKKTFDIGFEYVGKMADIMVNNNIKLDGYYKEKLSTIEKESKDKSDLIREAMRRDLKNI